LRWKKLALGPIMLIILTRMALPPQ